ncbi:MAG: hypothetical protein MSH28_04005 [Clostridiales bacterium]|nr:hypothetical protein [Clostridiales bacterium]
MIKTTEILKEELFEYQNPVAKIKRMNDDGTLTPIIRGLYETDASVPGYLLVAAIYGPSYLSFEFALSYYGLIPEAAYNFTCATFEKKKTKQYTTPFGTFTYRDVPSAAYPAEVMAKEENGYAYFIAAPEKAICDMLYKTSPLNNITGIKEYLFSNLRIDFEAFAKLDLFKMQDLCALYKTQNHRLLERLLKKGIV